MSKLKIYKRTIKNESNIGIQEKKQFLNISQEIAQIPKNTYTMEPILVRLTDKVPNPICLTKTKFDDNNIKFYNNYKCNTNTDNYKKSLYVPPIGIVSGDILRMYNIDNIDSLNNYINDMIESGSNYHSMNRILNCWIRNNFDLIKNNSFLEKIYYKILSIYLDSKIIKKINLEKEIKEFINKWISKKSADEFNFDLYEDLYSYLSNK
jgi:hypothetical protein